MDIWNTNPPTAAIPFNHGRTPTPFDVFSSIPILQRETCVRQTATAIRRGGHGRRAFSRRRHGSASGVVIASYELDDDYRYVIRLTNDRHAVFSERDLVLIAPAE